MKKCKQIGGNHYDNKIDILDMIVLNKIPYVEGDIIQYVSRHTRKNGIEDLKKAKSLIDYLINNYDEIYEQEQ